MFEEKDWFTIYVFMEKVCRMKAVNMLESDRISLLTGFLIERRQ
jgi:hypothetical protein